MTKNMPEKDAGTGDPVVACYTDWSHRYFDEWYGDDPDRHPPAVRLVRDHLDAAKAATVLDAGCGPASMLRLVQAEGRALHGIRPDAVDDRRSAEGPGRPAG